MIVHIKDGKYIIEKESWKEFFFIRVFGYNKKEFEDCVKGYSEVRDYILKDELLYANWFIAPFAKAYYASIRGWWSIPKKIRKYNRSECEYNVPDWQNGRGTKVKPLLGVVLIVPEAEKISFNWFKYLKRYKKLNKKYEDKNSK